MSPARRRSGRGKGGANTGAKANANQAANGQGAQGQGGGGQQGGGKPKKAKLAADFWEVAGADPGDLTASVTVPADPTALVRSLGAPALPGQGTNAEHYFTAVYEKASHVAYALAVANGLVAGEDEDSDESPADAPPA